MVFLILKKYKKTGTKLRTLGYLVSFFKKTFLKIASFLSYFAQKIDHFCHWGEDTAYVAFLQGGSLLLLSCRNGFWFNILTYWDIFHEFIQYIKSILVMIFFAMTTVSPYSSRKAWGFGGPPNTSRNLN